MVFISRRLIGGGRDQGCKCTSRAQLAKLSPRLGDYPELQYVTVERPGMVTHPGKPDCEQHQHGWRIVGMDQRPVAEKVVK